MVVKHLTRSEIMKYHGKRVRVKIRIPKKYSNLFEDTYEGILRVPKDYTNYKNYHGYVIHNQYHDWSFYAREILSIKPIGGKK